MTLVELVIGLGISIVLLCVIMPRNKTEKYSVDCFARQMVSDIRYVRSINMNGNTNLHIEQFPMAKPPYYEVKQNGNTIKKISLPKGSNIVCPYNIIKFKPDGTLYTKGETIIISLESIKLEITIVPFSGRVLLKEGKYAS